MIRGLPVALTGWSPGRTRGASGGIRETITRRSRSAAGASGDAWRTRTTSGKIVSARHSGTGGKFGKHSEGGLEVYRIGSRLELRDAWRTRTTSGKMFSGSALGDTCHLPKGLRKVGCFGLVSERGLPEGLLRRVAQGR